MITIEQHKQNADSRWQQEKAAFSKAIRLEKSSAVKEANIIQCLFVIAVQWCEVDIRRCLIDMDFGRVIGRAENPVRGCGQL